jgi:hypothetical protein
MAQQRREPKRPMPALEQEKPGVESLMKRTKGVRSRCLGRLAESTPDPFV